MTTFHLFFLSIKEKKVLIGLTIGSVVLLQYENVFSVVSCITESHGNRCESP